MSLYELNYLDSRQVPLSDRSLDQHWEVFLYYFCRADVVCHQAEPNLLGWFVLIFVVPVVLWAWLKMLIEMVSIIIFLSTG